MRELANVCHGIAEWALEKLLLGDPTGFTLMDGAV
jgi:hypothetical protein